ncbi:hypothetical protein KL930_005132 [Ogataea haglerorum]|uniref:Uncharacterized protein n=1 Tax=Ogataea haglerorum TaxID=1937702 RepID=A0ABQ7R9K5_9ASCO|nr:hypothetical protein KL951_005103 [Ogataea haglerorum]KAG7702703.1 hypothetical protein KL914_005090 [Ogataea haglerorum]KAG7702795.1 hypothetical protein KL950_005064 [Ogataea haglerorum]KAG7753783.1 hypothetical protein KL947_005136 [Ogataea haglerorum]KAG7761886.1 hypothetical protein KL946_005112 [Ogataea haglerorum]
MYLAMPMKKQPPLDFTRKALERFLPISENLRKYTEKQAKLAKIERLALEDFLEPVPIASPRELAFDYLLSRDHQVLMELCTGKILKLVIDAAQLENQKSLLVVEMLVDQLRPLAGFDRIENLVKSAITKRSEFLSNCLRLAVILTTERESGLHDGVLVMPLLELVRRSHILSGNIASTKDQEDGLFAVGVLYNLQEHVFWPPDTTPLFEELLHHRNGEDRT